MLGAGGMLGHMAVRTLSQEHSVVGTTRAHPEPKSALARFLPIEDWIGGVDVRQEHQLLSLMEKVKPDVVLNCVGLVKQKMDALSYQESIEINSLLPHRLARLCDVNDVKLIQISTDCVFGCGPGVKSQFTEPDASDLYGKTKFLGEVTYGSALTLRTSIVGRQLSGEESFFEWVLSQRKRKVKGYQRALYTGLTTMELTRIISKIISEKTQLVGLWQIASPAISKYDLIDRLNKMLNLGITLVPDNDFICDRRLDGAPFESHAQIQVSNWENMLTEFVTDQKNYMNQEIDNP